jgi:hypothetical protein
LFAHRLSSLTGSPPTALLEETPFRIGRVLNTHMSSLDTLIDGLRSSEVTLFESNCDYTCTLLHLLCVNAIAEFDEEVVWIDGGNTVDPYAISALCKRMRLDKRDILSRVNISRAFTAYQLVTLIDDKLEEQVRDSSAAMVVVSSITDMFMDEDMKWMESYQLLRRCTDEIRKVTKTYETISLVTDHTPRHAKPDHKMNGLLRAEADLVVQMRKRRDGIVVKLPRDGRAMIFHPVQWNQMILEDFGGANIGEDGSYIPLGPGGHGTAVE